MGKWDKIKEAIGIPNDEEEIFGETEGAEEVVEREPMRGKIGSSRGASSRAAEPAPSKGHVNMVIIRSSDYSDARTVADHILANRAVLLNLENCNKEMAQRILDFLSGVVYAQGGDLQRVAHSTYAVTPRNVGLQGELSEESREEEF
jgi:cell division inhibitor SepF